MSKFEIGDLVKVIEFGKRYAIGYVVAVDNQKCVLDRIRYAYYGSRRSVFNLEYCRLSTQIPEYFSQLN